MFKLTIKTGNAAFEDAPGYELARILREVAESVESGRERGSMFDYNGNNVGEWKLP